MSPDLLADLKRQSAAYWSSVGKSDRAHNRHPGDTDKRLRHKRQRQRQRRRLAALLVA